MNVQGIQKLAPGNRAKYKIQYLNRIIVVDFWIADVHFKIVFDQFAVLDIMVRYRLDVLRKPLDSVTFYVISVQAHARCRETVTVF